MSTPLTAYAETEKGYTEQEIAIARRVIGEDALRGIGYGKDYKLALRVVRLTLKSVES